MDNGNNMNNGGVPNVPTNGGVSGNAPTGDNMVGNGALDGGAAGNAPVDAAQYDARQMNAPANAVYNSAAVYGPQQVTPQTVTAEQIAAVANAAKKDQKVSLIKTIAIVILSLFSVTFLALFIWMLVSYTDARSDVDGQISVAVNEAVDEQKMKDEAEFAEREKDPYRTFAGPVDYGELTFEYPKTWSVYIAADASNGGDFIATFNPIEVNAASDINALHLAIRDTSYDAVSAEYQRYMERTDANLTVESITFNGITGEKYSGTIPNTELNGYVVIFKIRDKTAVLQTDSVLFEGDFYALLETVRFNA